MKKPVLLIFIFAAALLSQAAASDLLNGSYAAVQIHPAELDVSDLVLGDQQYGQRLAAHVTDATFAELARLFSSPVSLSVGPDTDAEPRHLLIVEPLVKSVARSVNEMTGYHELLITVELILSQGGVSESFSITALGFDQRSDLASQAAADEYARQLGYLIAEETSPETAVQIESLYNGYITGRIPEKTEISSGDEFLILSEDIHELGLLTIVRVFPYAEDDMELHAAEYMVNYSEVPLQAGMELHRKPEYHKIPLTIYFRQSLGSSGIGIFSSYSCFPVRLRFSAGISGGYSWGSAPV
ncbi:MAG: hypothetical protein PF495_08465, partial [Spirochaetales bacterium]|nr:hypothetical protein [Spirochaetales bacterium]